MTKEEFYSYVDSFKKEPGQYTVEEMLDIGIKHKALDLRDKNWQELVDKLGWSGSKDSFRMFVNSHAAKDATSYEMSDYDRIYMAKTQVRDSYNALRRTLRDNARIEDFKDMVKEAVTSLPKLPKIQVTSVATENTDSEAILNFSDLHIGPDFENSYNKYNYDIAVKRVSKLVNETIKYCQSFKVTRLTVLNLGDAISGIIHETLRYEQQMDVVEQTMKAAELISDMLNNLQAAAPELIYRSVTDNHSRITPDKNKHIEKESFSKIIDWFVEERLKDTKIQFPHDNIDDGVGKFNLMNGKLVMFSHGHQDSKTSVVQDFTALTKEIPDYVLLAHFHSGAEKTFNATKVIINGSIIGCDTYAYGRRLFGEPEQKLLIFEKDNFLNLSINLK